MNAVCPFVKSPKSLRCVRALTFTAPESLSQIFLFLESHIDFGVTYWIHLVEPTFRPLHSLISTPAGPLLLLWEVCFISLTNLYLIKEYNQSNIQVSFHLKFSMWSFWTRVDYIYVQICTVPVYVASNFCLCCSFAVFLSDPSPIIVYPCHSLTHSLTP